MGFRVSILSLGETDDLSRDLSDDVGFSRSRRFDFLRSVRFLSPLLSSLFGVFEVTRQIRSGGPDIVCAMQWAAKIPASLAGALFRKKTVLVEINSSSYELRLKGVKSSIHPKFLARRVAYGLASAVAANSRGLAGPTASFFSLPKVEVIHNGIDIEAVRRMSKEPAGSFWPDQNIPLVVTAGRLVEQKGFEFLIEAVGILNHGGVPVRLLILGEGKLREFLEWKIEGRGLGGLVRISGFECNPYPHMARGDVFACSSLSEGMSNAILEAMALGLPVVSTDHDFGAGEMIEHGKSGLLVPVGDARAMAEAVRDILADSELRGRLVRGAGEAIQNFSLDAMTGKYGDLFRSVTGK